MQIWLIEFRKLCLSKICSKKLKSRLILRVFRLPLDREWSLKRKSHSKQIRSMARAGILCSALHVSDQRANLPGGGNTRLLDWSEERMLQCSLVIKKISVGTQSVVEGGLTAAARRLLEWKRFQEELAVPTMRQRSHRISSVTSTDECSWGGKEEEAYRASDSMVPRTGPEILSMCEKKTNARRLRLEMARPNCRFINLRRVPLFVKFVTQFRPSHFTIIIVIRFQLPGF